MITPTCTAHTDEPSRGCTDCEDQFCRDCAAKLDSRNSGPGFDVCDECAVPAPALPPLLIETPTIRYVGSQAEFRGQMMRLLGICGCRRCDREVRYRLAELGDHTAALTCVRPGSILAAPGGAAEADAIARILAEIDEVAITPLYEQDCAARWTPSDSTH